MGNVTQGLQTLGNYGAAANDAAAVQILINLIPNPDAPHGTGAAAGGGKGAGFLDEMSPGAAAQLRAELTALQNAVDNTNTL